MKAIMFLLGLILLNFLTLPKQDEKVKEIIRDKRGNTKIVRFIDGKYDIPSATSKDLVKQYFNTTKDDELIVKSSNTDRLGTHVRYYQFYNGIKVENAEVIVHEKNGQVRIISAKIQHISDLDINPIKGKEEAIQIALNQYNAKVYLWQDSINTPKIFEKEASLFYPSPELVIWNDQDKKDYFLAYKIIVDSFDPLGSRTYFVESNSGRILKWYENANHSDAIGQAVTKYSGTVNLHTDSYSGSYRLYDNSRNCVLRTINSENQTGSYFVEFMDSNNIWEEHHNTDMDDAALDAHYALQKTYDYFKAKFNRNSYDGNNHSVIVYSHYDVNLADAIWWNSLSSITLGDGDNYLTTPVSSLDAIAHEFGHGVTSSYVNANESGEPSAIKEGLSNIWGACVENYANISGNSPWIVGEDYHIYTSHAIDMADPHNSHYHIDWNLSSPAYPYPDTYNSYYWFIGGWDNYGEHINSSVLSHWFYLLTHGKADTNENGSYYAVSGIGFDDAAEIVYGYYDYISVGNDFEDICYYTKYIAEDLFGSNSNQAIQTKNAWYAVGLGDEVPNIIGGNPIVCEEGETTFSFPSEFNNTSVWWAVSNNLTISTGQGTRTVTVAYNDAYATGSGTITATYNHGNGNIIAQTNVWVGSDLQDPEYIEIKGENYEFVEHTNDYWEVCPSTIYRLQAHSSSTVSQWDWTIPESWELLSNENSPEILVQTGDYILWEDEIQVHVYNYTCDTWIYYADYLFVTEPPLGCGESMQLSLYPNPASNSVEVELVSSNKNKTFNEYSVSIIDNLGTIYYRSKESSTKFTLSVNNLRNGKYLILVSAGKTRLSKPLIVNH